MNYLLIVSLLLGAEPTAADRFSDVRIEKPFDRYLLASPLLMESTGAKVIKLPKKRSLVLAVASTVLKDNSPDERLRAERVCKDRALAYVVQEEKGVQVFHCEETTDTTAVVTLDGKEHGMSVSASLDITKTRVEGFAKGLSVVGKWKSKDGDIFYLAIGGIVNRKGNIVQGEVGK